MGTQHVARRWVYGVVGALVLSCVLLSSTTSLFRWDTMPKIERTRVILLKRHLDGELLSQAQLSGTDLSSASMRRVGSIGADFERANLTGAAMDRFSCTSCKFRDAVLRETSLRGAMLLWCDLTGVDLRGADLRGTRFRRSRLDGARLQWARADASTEWPPGFDPTQHGLGPVQEPVADDEPVVREGSTAQPP